jgi:hypothetical protein
LSESPVKHRRYAMTKTWRSKVRTDIHMNTCKINLKPMFTDCVFIGRRVRMRFIVKRFI